MRNNYKKGRGVEMYSPTRSQRKKVTLSIPCELKTTIDEVCYREDMKFTEFFKAAVNDCLEASSTLGRKQNWKGEACSITSVLLPREMIKEIKRFSHEGKMARKTLQIVCMAMNLKSYNTKYSDVVTDMVVNKYLE